MVLVYLATKQGYFGQGQMLVFIFQHHGVPWFAYGYSRHMYTYSYMSCDIAQ